MHVLGGRINWKAIDANVIGLEGLEAELAEIDENLMRVDLVYLEHVDHMARRKVIHEILHPETKNGMRNGQTSKTADSAVLGFVKDTAEKTGISERVIYEDVKVSNALAADVKESLRGTDLADNKTDLLALAHMDHDQQREIVGDIANAETCPLAHTFTVEFVRLRIYAPLGW